MIVRALIATKDFKRGVKYDLPDAQAQALIISGVVTFVAIAPAHNREKAIPKKWDTRKIEHNGA